MTQTIFPGIREKQRQLVELLVNVRMAKISPDDFAPSTKELLENTLEYCVKYEISKRPLLRQEKAIQWLIKRKEGM